MFDKINEQVAASSEVAQVVEALERQYDAFVAAQENRSLLARDEELPSGEEIGAEFERFLAQQADERYRKDKDDPATTVSGYSSDFVPRVGPDDEVGDMTVTIGCHR